MVTQFLGQNRRNWPTAPSFIALTFHNGLDDDNFDGRVETSVHATEIWYASVQ